jgi:hypothetical protein
MSRMSVTRSHCRSRWRRPHPSRPRRHIAAGARRPLRACCHPTAVSGGDSTLGSDGALTSTRTCPHGATGVPFAGVDLNLTNRAQSTAMLSKRASPDDSSTLALTMVRSGATHTSTMATSPGVIRRADTRNDTGSSSKGATGKATGTGLPGAAQPLAAATHTATMIAVRIRSTRSAIIRRRRRGFI